MPLPLATVARTRVHTRRVSIQGWRREDGLWDIEARMTDLKDHDLPLASGLRRQGDALHDMWLRVTIDGRMQVHDVAASSDATPYPGFCEAIVPAYRRLIGLNLFDGFRRSVREVLGSTSGCAHLTELCDVLPTAALQTLASDTRDTEGQQPGEQPFHLDRCHALATDSEAVRRYYPRWFRDSKTGT
ncbi:MAG: hypothetical protein CVU17_07860 [Betaproteobacteria bacterium HGW-Betaproteobacteria-11]|nr:MAG: hypothetical protein CVU17_07860 [Betaproteobacteria bacterium HGW-Betaproteobacteria-11]